MQIETRGQSDSLQVRWPGRDWLTLLDAPVLAPGEGAMLCHWVASQWSRMPGGNKSSIILPRVFTQPETDHVVFYPGSFNPWHDGHLACVELTPHRPLVVVPDANPWKENTRNKDDCAWFEILNIVKKLPSDITLYPGFWSTQIQNPTVDWLPHAKWPRRSLTLGADSLLALPRWKEVGKLLQSLDTLFIVPRAQDKTRINEVIKELSKINTALLFSVLPEHQYEKLSSTLLRK